ncbi:MAG: aminoacyl-tRNA hydrolase [Anaerolineales bacterium]|nr:aminoacyl-tRNA hydrolase [Anaerolineales bacterium]MCS7246654.1 aminoacyl-tRNA hydrolase [Anaerolineales bacterium]MDW8160464.1 aminoacyl-tRNA hydrolase [Anaerolineales bacterium]MDW8446449.1 aminoacyl-tRNA hydrolase [Anaerolineales bacterium]
MSDWIPSAERSTYLIVGLGNPGKEYAQSRHNVGFMVVERMAEQHGLLFTRYEHRALVVKLKFELKTLILAKPQTFMNLSGSAVGALVRFYKVPVEQLMVIYDDIDLPFGTLRMRPGGSSGGHKGMQSILERLGRQDIPRLRIGVGRPKSSRLAAEYVLEKFSPQESLELPSILNRAVQALQDWTRLGIVEAMNRHNVNLLANQA